MSAEPLLAVALAAWLVAALLALAGQALLLARALLGLGGVALLVLIATTLPGGTAPIATALGVGGAVFRLSPAALWLMGFGLLAAVLATWVGSPAPRPRGWIVGAAASLIGALGVFGLQDAASFLIAWEIMSLGGAVMILGEGLAGDTGRPVLFMLALLEAGAVALLLAFILLAGRAGTLSFPAFAAAAAAMPRALQLFVGLLFLIGFGAKLGLLPFYEWFPGLYGAGSGASGVLLSGVVLNAAFFGLSRALIAWLPPAAAPGASAAGIFIVAVAVVSAILTALYAFQQEGWRELLGLSSAENGSVAVCLLGAALMFRREGLPDLAGLAWTVALLHLAAHALAKSTLFLAADGVYRSCGDYRLTQRGVLRHAPWMFGVGALFAAMSLAAMPPQAGFVSEWYLFQTFFQGFHLASVAGRLTDALAGAGLALTAAVAFATYVKAMGIGLLGGGEQPSRRLPLGNALAVGLLGLGVLLLAVGMPLWLRALEPVVAALFGTTAVAKMHVGPLLVPATGAPIRVPATFAFISPSLLVIVMPLLALIPLALLLTGLRRSLRRAPVWYGGRDQPPHRAATTALTFANALRTFYSFVYRPTAVTDRELADETPDRPYFIRRLVFTDDVAPLFGPYLFAPLERLTVAAAMRLRVIQSGSLNLYLSLVGALLVIILSTVLA
ncbi:MAG TPA: proton-conducting transporter membrane subunit [Stellaceae bacterium]|nr:proton-conducting transporter membrane subunit [Stellaceae bacterium]